MDRTGECSSKSRATHHMQGLFWDPLQYEETTLGWKRVFTTVPKGSLLGIWTHFIWVRWKDRSVREQFANQRISLPSLVFFSSKRKPSLVPRFFFRSQQTLILSPSPKAATNPLHYKGSVNCLLGDMGLYSAHSTVNTTHCNAHAKNTHRVNVSLPK